MLAFIHGRLALTAVMFALVLGIWATWNYFRGQQVTSSYWGAVVIGELLLLAQGALGILLFIIGARPADALHLLYGVLVVLTLPAVYVYTNGRTTRNENALYALASFFIFGLALRAIMTGGTL